MRTLRRWAMTLVVTAVLATVVYSPLVKADSDAPQIPHTTSGYEQCLSCHDAQGIKPTPPRSSKPSCMITESGLGQLYERSSGKSAVGKPTPSPCLFGGGVFITIWLVILSKPLQGLGQIPLSLSFCSLKNTHPSQ